MMMSKTFKLRSLQLMILFIALFFFLFIEIHREYYLIDYYNSQIVFNQNIVKFYCTLSKKTAEGYAIYEWDTYYNGKEVDSIDGFNGKITDYKIIDNINDTSVPSRAIKTNKTQKDFMNMALNHENKIKSLNIKINHLFLYKVKLKN